MWSLWSREVQTVCEPGWWHRWVVKIHYLKDVSGMHSCSHTLFSFWRAQVRVHWLSREIQTMCLDEAEKRTLLGISFHEIWSNGFQICGEVQPWLPHKGLPYSSWTAGRGLDLFAFVLLCHCCPVVHAQHSSHSPRLSPCPQLHSCMLPRVSSLL